MNDKNDDGEKTEKPTPKRLKDARKKGNIAKSRDLTSTVGLLIWIVIAAFVLVLLAGRIAGLADMALQAVADPSLQVMGNLAAEASRTLLILLAMIFVPVAAASLLADFLQVGPVMAFDKIKPKADNLNPVEGFKRMFSLDNLVEVIKAVVKTALLIAIVIFVGYLMLRRILALPGAEPGAIGMTLAMLGFFILSATVAVFVLVSFVDASYQRFSYMKKLKMSRRDIKQEHKQTEGDPQLKQERRQLHQEWSQRNAMEGASNAMALVVNPTHIAIALDYDPETEPIPSIAAKGRDETARVMREAAERNDVPILRNVELARELFDRVELYDTIPSDMFDAVAQVILWAQEMRHAPGTAAEKQLPADDGADSGTGNEAEDA